MRNILLILFLFLSFSLFSQENTELLLDLTEQLNELLESNEILIRKGDAETAQKKSDEFKPKLLKNFGENSVEYGRFCHNYAYIIERKGEYEEAEKYYLQARKIYEETIGKENHLYAGVLNDVAITKLITGDLDTGIKYLEESLLVTKQIGDTGNEKYCGTLVNLAYAYFNKGNYQEAEEYLLIAKKIFEEELKNTDHEFYLSCLFVLGNVNWMRGYLHKAESLHAKVGAIRAKSIGEESREYASSVQSVGMLNMDMGKYEKAEDHLLKALEIYGETVGKEHYEYTHCLNALAKINLLTGQYNGAEEMFQKNVEVQRKIVGENHDDYALAIMDLAAFNVEVGFYQKAEKLFLEGLSILEVTLGESYLPGGEYALELASLYLKMKRYNEAETYFQKGIKVIEKNEIKEDPTYANTLINYGSFLLETKKWNEARIVLEKVKGILEKEFEDLENPIYANGLEKMAQLEMQQNNFKIAEKLLNEVVQIREKKLGPQHFDLATSHHLLAQVKTELGKNSEAETLIHSANTIFKENIQRDANHFTEKEMQGYLTNFRAHTDWFNSFNHYKTSNNHLAETYNNNLFYKGFLMDKTLELQKLTQGTPDSIQQKYKTWKGTQRALANLYSQSSDERKELIALESEAKQLEKELIQELAGFEDRTNQVSWTSVKDQLQKGEAAIEFMHYQYYNPLATDSIFYAALVLRKEDESPKFIPLFEEKSPGSLKATKKLYSPNIEISNSLGQMIWKPLSKHLKGINTVYFSPSGLLHRINFGAIPISETEVIADRLECHQMASTRYLVKSKVTPTYDELDALVFGGVDFDRDTFSIAATSSFGAKDERPVYRSIGESMRSIYEDEWPYLEWTAKEANDIKQMLRKSGAEVKLLQGAGASEGYFKMLGVQSPSPRVLHMATHGYFFPDADPTAATNFESSENPLIRSGLVLAGANVAWKGQSVLPQKEDGILTAYEIAQMDLSNTELVVLSACDTGLGDIDGNEGVYGLQRAFKMAGVKYVLMSLWSVGDKKTYDFMTTFYQEWLSDIPIPQAYQNAQRAMKEKYALPFNPRNWAGFVLIE